MGCNSTILNQVDGQVRCKVHIHVGHHSETIILWTMNLTDDAHILLGHDWLQYHNPQVDWKGGTFTLDSSDNSSLSKWDKKLNKDDRLYIMDVQGYITN